MDEAREEMRALKGKQMEERLSLQDEYHNKMKTMLQRHQKERADLKVKYFIDQEGDEVGSVRSENRKNYGNLM